jgi:peptidoglycan L-alanyl-D-glutamate endopeptidase CwlK
VRAVLGDLQSEWGDVWVAEGQRTPAQQRAKFEAGVSQLKGSRSPHVKGLGADIVLHRYGWETPGGGSHPFWQALGAAAQRHGLEWGGSWRTFKDWAHVEWPYWERF